jgi:hypothetical protein
LGYSFPPKAQPGGRGNCRPEEAPLPPGLNATQEPLSPALPPTTAVTPATGTQQRVGTGGPGAGTKLAAGLAFLTVALLAGVSRVGETLTVHKHLCLQDAVWAEDSGSKSRSKG